MVRIARALSRSTELALRVEDLEGKLLQIVSDPAQRALEFTRAHCARILHLTMSAMMPIMICYALAMDGGSPRGLVGRGGIRVCRRGQNTFG